MAAGTALRKINARVKHLKKKHPGAKHTTLQKQAGREYRAGKLGGVKKKSTGKKRIAGHMKKRTGRKVSHRRKIGAAREVGHDRADNKRVNVTIGNISTAQARSVVVSNTKEQLAWALLQRDTAKNKTSRRKINKKVSSLRRQLHNYQ